jgi:cyclohexanecarboxyl-CoA dehydrogenase
VRGKGISAFLVPLDLPGVTREAYSDMGSRAVGRGAAHFTDVRIPANHLLGEEGQGCTQVMQGFDFSRALIGLQCVGLAQVTLDDTWAYVSQREAFDQPLSKFQGVSFPLAEAETLLSAARLSVTRRYGSRIMGCRTRRRLPCASGGCRRLFSSRTAAQIVQNCLLLHGQYGYRTDLPLEQRLRDVLALQIGDGTPQIMKLIIARRKLGRALAP